jgi:hypothetical protein
MALLTSLRCTDEPISLWELTDRVDERLGPYPGFATEIAAGVRSHVAVAM